MKKIIPLLLLILLFNCSTNDYELNDDEAFIEDLFEYKELNEDVFLYSQEEIDSFAKLNYTHINGSFEVLNYDKEEFDLGVIKSLKAINADKKSIKLYGNIKGINTFSNFDLTASSFSIVKNKNLTSLQIFKSLNLTYPEQIAIIENENLQDFDLYLGEKKEIYSITIDNNTSLTKLTSIANLESLDNLSISNSNLKNLSDLNKINDIKYYLTIDNCNLLESLEGIENIVTVNSFKISNCNSLEALKGVKNIKNINSLNISNCNSLENLSGLENSEIQKLYINQNQNLKDINAISNCSELTSLTISNNSSLESIQGFNNTESHFSGVSIVENENITTINGFNNIETLGTLKIDSNLNIQSILGFERLSKLRNFYLVNNTVEDINAFKVIKEIENTLAIQNCGQLKNIDFFENIETVGFNYMPYGYYYYHNNSVYNGTIVERGVGKINITSNKNLENINGIKTLKKIIGLDILISNNPSLKELVKFHQIEIINIDYLKLENNDSLSNIENLFSFYINKPSFENVYIRDNENLTSLEPFKNTKVTKSLTVYNNPNLTDICGLKQSFEIYNFKHVIGNNGINLPTSYSDHVFKYFTNCEN